MPNPDQMLSSVHPCLGQGLNSCDSTFSIERIHSVSFYIRTSNFGAEAYRSYFFRDLSLKTFLRCSYVTWYIRQLTAGKFSFTKSIEHRGSQRDITPPDFAVKRRKVHVYIVYYSFKKINEQTE